MSSLACNEDGEGTLCTCNEYGKGTLCLDESTLSKKVFHVHLGSRVFRGKVDRIARIDRGGKHIKYLFGRHSSEIITNINEIYIIIKSFTLRKSHLTHIKHLMLTHPDIIGVELHFEESCITFEADNNEDELAMMEKARLMMGEKIIYALIICDVKIWDKEELIALGG